jgi:hypothetical protein
VGEEAVPFLLSLESLERIEFYGTPVSNESLKKLRDGLPNLIDIDVRPGGALLGIVGSRLVAAAPQGGALVHQVQVGGAAEKAGLRPGDVITGLNDQQVEDFEDLTQQLADFAPGQPARLTVIRPSQAAGPAIVLDVTFDRWGQRAPVGISKLPKPEGDVQRYLRPQSDRGYPSETSRGRYRPEEPAATTDEPQSLGLQVLPEMEIDLDAEESPFDGPAISAPSNAPGEAAK